jgi:hypothetical protein
MFLTCLDRFQKPSKFSVIATNVLSTTNSEKTVSREEAPYPAKVLQMGILASVDSPVVAEILSRLPRAQEDLEVGRVGTLRQILKRFSSKFTYYLRVSNKQNSVIP